MTLNEMDTGPLIELAQHRESIIDCLSGITRFPMRPHPRPTSKEAQDYEKIVKRRFENSQDNLFAFSIDPMKYLNDNNAQKDAALYRFFILNETSPIALIRDHLGDANYDCLQRVRILQESQDSVESLYRLIPFYKQLFLADRYDRTHNEMVYLSYDSLFFANWLRTNLGEEVEGKTIIDICSGSGILGLSLFENERKPRFLTGFEKNSRACSLAERNALLNTVETATFQNEDLSTFQSNDPETVYIFNPPFVFMPQEKSILDSDGGNYGTELTLKILDRIAQQISESGSFYAITCSPVLEDEDVPILVRQCESLPLSIHCKAVGEMPPFERFARFYKENGIKRLEQLILSGSPGSDVSYQRDQEAIDTYCFG